MNIIAQTIFDGFREESKQHQINNYGRLPDQPTPAALNPTNAPDELFCNATPRHEDRYIITITPKPIPASKYQPAHTPTLSPDQPAPHGFYIIQIVDRVRIRTQAQAQLPIGKETHHLIPAPARFRQSKRIPAAALLHYEGDTSLRSGYYQGMLRVITQLRLLNGKEVTAHDAEKYLSKREYEKIIFKNAKKKNKGRGEGGK